MNPTIHRMKTRNLLVTMFFGLGLLTQALIAQGGPANSRGNARPETAPITNPEECPYVVNGECPGCLIGSPEDCPFAIDGICPGTPVGPNGAQPGTPGARLNPDADPKLDGTGGYGKPANPDGPQDGSAPGQGYRGGRG
jgi:hypothetical protein